MLTTKREARAIHTLLAFLLPPARPPEMATPTRDQARDAAVLLAKSAMKKVSRGPRHDDVAFHFAFSPALQALGASQHSKMAP